MTKVSYLASKRMQKIKSSSAYPKSDPVKKLWNIIQFEKRMVFASPEQFRGAIICSCSKVQRRQAQDTSQVSRRMQGQLSD